MQRTTCRLFFHQDAAKLYRVLSHRPAARSPELGRSSLHLSIWLLLNKLWGPFMGVLVIIEPYCLRSILGPLILGNSDICINWGVPQTGFGVRSKLRKRRACTPGHRVSCHVFENLTKLSFHVFWGLTRLSFHTFWGLTRLSFHVVLGLDKALFPRV